MAGEFVTKSAVSVTEMAQMVGLSRARFYQLVRSGTFPAAECDPVSKRPFYGEGPQKVCLEVRRRNCGIDGKPILFYSRRRGTGAKLAKRPAAKAKAGPGEYDDLIDLLNSAKITATPSQVGAAVKAAYPGGTAGIDAGVIIGKIVPLIRRNATGSVG